MKLLKLTLIQSAAVGFLIILLSTVAIKPASAGVLCNDGPYVPSDKIMSWATGSLFYWNWKAPWCGVKKAKFRINLHDSQTFVKMRNAGFLHCFGIHQRVHHGKFGAFKWIYYQYKASRHCSDNAWSFVTSI